MARSRSRSPRPSPRPSTTTTAAPARPGRTVVPVVAETLAVGRRRVPSGRLRVRKAVRTRRVVVDEPLVREATRVERIAVNRPIEAPPAIRHEGDTLVIPLVEETLVVEKRLVLREEVRITKRRVAARAPRQVTLRSEEAVVERARPQSGWTRASDATA